MTKTWNVRIKLLMVAFKFILVMLMYGLKMELLNKQIIVKHILCI